MDNSNNKRNETLIALSGCDLIKNDSLLLNLKIIIYNWKNKKKN